MGIDKNHLKHASLVRSNCYAYFNVVVLELDFPPWVEVAQEGQEEQDHTGANGCSLILYANRHLTCRCAVAAGGLPHHALCVCVLCSYATGPLPDRFGFTSATKQVCKGWRFLPAW